MKQINRHYPLIVLCLALLMGMTAKAQAESFKLELKKLSNQSMITYDPSKPDFMFRRTSGQYIQYIGNAVTPLPVQNNFASLVKKDRDAYESKYPFRGVFKLGNDTLLFAMDSSNLMEKGYEKLYLDLNRNGDLSDETVIEASKLPEGINFGQGSSQREFPIQEIALELDGQKIDYAFNVSVYTNNVSDSDGPNYARASLMPSVYRQGEIEIDGKKHSIALLDFNSNGKFNDEYQIDDKIDIGNDRIYPSVGDKLFLDLDTSNPNSGYYLSDRSDTFPVSKLLSLDGKLYNVAVSSCGDSITITPSTVATGFVKNPNSRYRTVYFGDKGLIKIEGDASDAVPMPEGDWKLLEYTIDATDKSSTVSGRRSNLTLISAMGTKKGPMVKVKQGETVNLPFGPPYKPLVEVQDNGSQPQGSRIVSLNLLLQGSGEEICRALTVNGQNPEAPSFVIVTKDKEIIERGSFEYG